MVIRLANTTDLSRIAEIYVYNNRINYYPIFQDIYYSFNELNVVSIINEYFSKEEIIKQLYVYDDGIIKGFLVMHEHEIMKLYVDSFFQNKGIGNKIITFAIEECQAQVVWTLEKNIKAIKFYQINGFTLTKERALEEGTSEYLVKLILKR